jgi:hypothetical protein
MGCFKRRGGIIPARQIVDLSRVGFAQAPRGLCRRSSGHSKGAPVSLHANALARFAWRIIVST